MSTAKILLKNQDTEIIKDNLGVEDLNEVNINITQKKKTGFLGTYSIVFHDSIKEVSKMDLKPNAYKITLYLFSIISMGNIIINFSQKKIADDLGLQPSNVSRSFKQLFEKKILIKDEEDGHVYLNSNLCTMGIPKNFNKQTMENLQKSQVETDDFNKQINLFKGSNSTKVKKENNNSKGSVLEFPKTELDDEIF